MDIPPEFKNFGIQYHQDIDSIIDRANDEEFARHGLKSLSRQQQVALKRFLTELLRSKLSHDKLADMWEATGTDIYFSRGLDRFLAMTRDAIPD